MKKIIFSPRMAEAVISGRKVVTRRLSCRYDELDLVYVAEQWRIGAWRDDAFAIDYRRPCGGWLAVPEWREPPWEWWCDFHGRAMELIEESVADARSALGDGPWLWEPGAGPCRPRAAMYMPRWASRAELIIDSIREERLQEISDDDAVAEGFDGIDEFARYWDGLYAKRPDVCWDADPRVYRIEFAVLPS